MEEEKKESRRGRPRKVKRTKEQIEADRKFCSNLFLRGHTYRDMAERLKQHHNEIGGIHYEISFVMIQKDMQALLIQWKRDSLQTVDEYLQRELNKLDKIEEEAWMAWEKSKTGKIRAKTRNLKTAAKKYVDDTDKLDENGELMEPRPIYEGFDEEATETSAGNPKFFDVILSSMQRRAKLMGLDAPEKMDYMINERAGDSDKPEYEANDMDEALLFQLVDQMQETAYVKFEATKDLPN